MMFDQDQIGEVTLALCSGVTELVYKGGVDTEQAEEGVMIGKVLGFEQGSNVMIHKHV